MNRNPIRILIGKLGLDGHDRGAKIIVQALRDAGMEVFYTGIRQTPEKIVETVLQKRIQVVGISIHSGAHMQMIPPMIKLLREKGAEEVLVIAGGIIPEEDIAYLKERGVREVFTPGTPLEEIMSFINNYFES